MGNKLLYLLLVTVMCLTRRVVGGDDHNDHAGWSHTINVDANENGARADLNLDRRLQNGYIASLGFMANTNGDWERRAGLSRTYPNGQFGIHGQVNSYGGVGVRASWSHKWRRSVKAQRFNVTLMADPCDFDFYDHDKDGGISKKEMATIFGDEVGADRLFDALDRETVDGVIIREEFAFAPMVINNCFQDSEEE
ncbi:uncharacterized protein LOC128241471 [Mya arenaria]|uniref:uncharacterized protein LOC128241471 n=1 Tax=Mya arenaria TaxID=6604 RepID=UPI0022E13499|nr:uncharacterized protein LOC128241471 [Mya arenaria]